MTKFTFALVAYILALNLFDLYSTWYVLSHGGEEKNPVLLWLHARMPGGWWWLVVAKLTVAVLVLAGIPLGWWIGNGVYLLVVLAVLYSFVMLQNYGAMRKS